MIDLLNRRFVPFFFNRSGEGEGDDEAAAAFTAQKGGNRYAYLAAYTPDGEYLGEPEIYADEEDTYAFLLDLLERHPEYAAPTEEERAVLERAAAPGADTAARLAGARLSEELGDADTALAGYRSVAEDEAVDVADRSPALLGRLRLLRHEEDWEAHARVRAELARLAASSGATDLADDLAVEEAYAHLAAERWQAAHDVLAAAPGTGRLADRTAEIRFSMGVALWFLGRRDEARRHWVWIVETLPDDRLARRAYWAAVAEHVPYANPHLGGFAGDVGNVSPGLVEEAYEEVRRKVREASAPGAGR